MAQVPRNAKASSGTTSFVDDTAARADEVNADFDTIYNEFNGNIVAANIDAAADIAPSQLGDYAANAAEFETDQDPGITGGAVTTFTTMEDELEALRYAVFRSVSNRFSGNSWRDAAVNGASLEDISRPNLLRNAGFESFNGAANAAPDGWTLVGTPTTVALTAANADGGGSAIRIEGSGANEGIQQTIPAAGLRASTSYVLRCRAFCVSGVTAKLSTANAGTEVSETTTSTSYVTLEGVFITDATPTAVDVLLTTDGGTFDATFDRVECFPILSAERTPQGSAVAFQSSTTSPTTVTSQIESQDSDKAWPMDDTPTPMSQAVVCPEAGFYIDVSAKLAGHWEATAALQTITLTLLENSVVKDTTTVQKVPDAGTEVADQFTLGYMNMSPTPGTTYTYQVNVDYTGNIGTAVFDAQGVGDVVASWLKVECKRFG